MSLERNNHIFKKPYIKVSWLGALIVGVVGVSSTVDTSALTYQSKTGINFTFDSSINITLSNPDLIISELAPGTVADSNEINVNVLTNNANGYTLNTTVGSNMATNANGAIYNTRALIHNTYTDADNTVISNNTGTKPVFNSVAYDASLATITEDNTWGYSYLDPGVSNTNTTWSNYAGLPLYSDTEHIATLKESTGTSAETGDSVKFKIAAKAASSQLSGEYNNVVNFIVVGAPDDLSSTPQTSPAGCISYFSNASNVEGTMGCQPIDSSATSATLLASNFSKEGYGFAGWSDRYDYMTNQNAKFYGPNEDITFEAGQYTGSNNGLALYAVWVKSQGNLQDSTKVAEVCGSLTVASSSTAANLSSVSALTDQRDGNTYAIAKLADGNCWMIENLRLESADTVGNNRFDSSITNQSLAQGYGGQFAGLADAEPAWKNEITTANSLYSTDGANGTINIGTSNASYRFPRYNNLNTPSNPSDRPQNPTINYFANNSTTVGMYSYGNYYSWHAAIADTTAYSSGDHNTTSICPTGWKIPLGDTSTGNIEQGASDVANKVPGFSYLDRKMGGTGQYQSTTADSLRWRKFPNNFVSSGYVSNGSVTNRGLDGYYWSSTDYSSDYVYYLNLSLSYVYPGTFRNFKYYGRSVRCVVSGV